MDYNISINESGVCQPVDPTKVEVVGNKIVVTFANGSVRQDDLPTVSLTGYVTTQMLNDHQHTLADITDFNPLAFATAAQGAKADSAVQPGAKLSIFNNDLNIPTSEEIETLSEAINIHINDTSNPHGVTKMQVGLGNVDNTPDASKPVSTAQQTEINNKYNAAVSYIYSKLGLKVDKVLGSRLVTEAEGIKIGEFDEKHYRKPVADLAGLTALPQTSLFDNERRYVASEGKDFFYDAQAVAGDAAPSDQVGSLGFWKSQTSTEGNSYTQWRLSTGGVFRKNMTNESILDLKATGLLSVAYTPDGVVTYSTTATKNATDAQLRDRSTHTGTQAISTVTNLQETLDNLIVAISQVEYDALVAAGTVNPKTLYVIPC